MTEPMQPTNELPEQLREKVKRLIKANVKYLVSDPDDPRVAILAQEQMEGFLFRWMREELSQAVEKERQKNEDLTKGMRIRAVQKKSMNWEC